MMVSDPGSFSPSLRADYAKGTGLTDGFPPDGVDGHEVRVLPYVLHSKTQPCIG
jgi:hypothetical protein